MASTTIGVLHRDLGIAGGKGDAGAVNKGDAIRGDLDVIQTGTAVVGTVAGRRVIGQRQIET